MQFENLDKDGLLALARPFGALVHRVGKVTSTWVAPDVLRAFQIEGLSLIANNFYSVVPDITTIDDQLWAGPAFERAWSSVATEDPRTVLNEILAFLPELKSIPKIPNGNFGWDNGMFPPLDAAVYYGLVRARRPQRILEIGAGYSTLIAVQALRANGSGNVACIEPYPSDILNAREHDLAHLWRSPVQQIADEKFSELSAGDFLFIDTSHASKAGSDVHDILFRVLPLLSSGVVVHIHDIFLPYEYPREWFNEVGIIWNEQYVVLSLLMNSARYRVLLANHLASHKQRDMLNAAFEDFDVRNLTQNMSGPQGASLWIVTQ